MTENSVKVGIDLEARSAAMFVQLASKYDSNIMIKIDNKSVNAKSIMGMLSLAVAEGQNVTISADGADEQQAVLGLCDYLNNV